MGINNVPKTLVMLMSLVSLIFGLNPKTPQNKIHLRHYYITSVLSPFFEKRLLTLLLSAFCTCIQTNHVQ